MCIRDRLGRIQFTLSYDFDQSTLTLKIIRAVDLAAKDITGRSDPYVKVMLLPDKKHKLLTNIKRRNLNPRWNEVFAFEGQNCLMLGCRHVGWTYDHLFTPEAVPTSSVDNEMH